VALKSIEKGAALVNDISGGADPEMFPMVASQQIPYVLMHIRGTPETMQKNPEYDDVTAEVFSELQSKVTLLRSLGVKDVIADPGIGFGKTVEHNYKLLENLPVFNKLGCPVLAGVSRKSMVCRVLNIKPSEALNGTTALNMIALLKGASVLRVHDTREAVETIKLFKALTDVKNEK
jgi:dihydropteroate synthase